MNIPFLADIYSRWETRVFNSRNDVKTFASHVVPGEPLRERSERALQELFRAYDNEATHLLILYCVRIAPTSHPLVINDIALEPLTSTIVFETQLERSTCHGPVEAAVGANCVAFLARRCKFQSLVHRFVAAHGIKEMGRIDLSGGDKRAGAVGDATCESDTPLTAP